MGDHPVPRSLPTQDDTDSNSQTFPPVYLQVGYNEDSTMVAFVVDTRRELGTEAVTDKETGLPKTYTAYFEAFFIGESGDKKYIFWFTSQYFQVFWDAGTKTLDFSGVYTHEGVDYDIIVAVLARTDIEDKRWEGSFTDGYINCKFVQDGASGAPGLFTGKRVALPKFNGPTGGTSSLESVTIDFDPAKFSRRR